MNSAKLTKSFFTRRRVKYCPQCELQNSYLSRNIIIYANASFSENLLLIEWCYDTNTHSFILIINNDRLNISHTITSLRDLKNTCINLNKLGYQIDDIRLLQQCYFCDNCFQHNINLAWFGNTNTFLVEDEYVKFADYSILCNYAKNTTYITDRTTAKRLSYNYDYIPNIDLKKYSSLTNKIKQILLLG